MTVVVHLPGGIGTMLMPRRRRARTESGTIGRCGIVTMMLVRRRSEGARSDAQNDSQSGSDFGEHDCGSCLRYGTPCQVCALQAGFWDREAAAPSGCVVASREGPMRLINPTACR